MKDSDSLITDKPVVSTQTKPQDNQDNRPTSSTCRKKLGHESQQGRDTKTDSYVVKRFWLWLSLQRFHNLISNCCWPCLLYMSRYIYWNKIDNWGTQFRANVTVYAFVFYTCRGSSNQDSGGESSRTIKNKDDPSQSMRRSFQGVSRIRRHKQNTMWRN